MRNYYFRSRITMEFNELTIEMDWSVIGYNILIDAKTSIISIRQTKVKDNESCQVV